MHKIKDTGSIHYAIEKLKIYMERQNKTMHGLASSLGFAYLLLYRLMTKKMLPTLNSLDMIAQNLGCTTAELVSSNIFLDIPCYPAIEDYLNGDTTKNIVRVYLPVTLLQPIIKEEFIVIKGNLAHERVEFNLNNISYLADTNAYQLFSLATKIHLDGFYLVRYNNKSMILEVINVSSTLISAKLNDRVVMIPVVELEIFAKFISYVELPNQFQPVVSGIAKP